MPLACTNQMFGAAHELKCYWKGGVFKNSSKVYKSGLFLIFALNVFYRLMKFVCTGKRVEANFN